MSSVFSDLEVITDAARAVVTARQTEGQQQVRGRGRPGEMAWSCVCRQRATARWDPEKGFYVRRRLRSPEREEEDGVRRCAGTASQAASFAVAEGH